MGVQSFSRPPQGGLVDGDRIMELEAKLAVIVAWLEKNQPDVFRRGLWDALESATVSWKRKRGDAT